MPVHIRRFYLKQLEELHKEKETKKPKDPKGMIHKPGVMPQMPNNKGRIIQPKRSK
jgi:hypothetical protein